MNPFTKAIVAYTQIEIALHGAVEHKLRNCGPGLDARVQSLTRSRDKAIETLDSETRAIIERTTL